jgi:hypothetical protein
MHSERLIAGFDLAAAGEHEFQALHMIASRADANRARAGRIDGQHAADGGDI